MGTALSIWINGYSQQQWKQQGKPHADSPVDQQVVGLIAFADTVRESPMIKPVMP